MRNSSTINMTEGNPTSLLIRFSIPMLIGNLVQQLYNFADSAIVGNYVGKDAFAAVGATTSITFLFFAMCNGFANGGGIIAAQHYGAGDEVRIKRCIVDTGFIMMIFPLVIGTFAFFLADPILVLLDTPSDIMHDSMVYLRVNACGLVFVSLYNYASAMLRAFGDSKTPLYFLFFSCILNIGLDMLFVCVFDMAVFGAAFATIISQFLSAAACLVYAEKKNPYFNLTKADLKLDGEVSAQVLKLGAPLSLQFSLIAISCMALQKVVNSFGTDTIAAFSATSRIEQIIHQPYQTLSAALSTYIGQNFGAKKMERIKEGLKKSVLIMVIFSVAMLPVMQFFGEAIVGLFVDNQTVIVMGAKALRISSLFYITLGTIYVIRGVLNGMGDSLFAVINGAVEVVGRFVVPILLTSVAAISLWGIWWSVGVVWAISGFTAWLRYMGFKRRRGYKI